MDSVEAIRSRLSIEEVVGNYVQLKKAGRNLKGLCPFHQEKSPSFIVSPDKGIAYCFGCRKGGDIFNFIQEVENVDFSGALQILGEKAGVQIVKTSQASKEEKQSVLNILQEAQRFFQQQLEDHEKARKYLENRGYGRAEQMKLGLGFAPDSFHQLTEFLQKQGFGTKEILNSGLASQKQVGDSHIYDRFRDRVMFPIHDPQGKLVAFGGRTLSSDPEAAKYLNSPETDLYHKGRTLYCFHLAKKSIKDLDRAIVVEGYFDALTAQLNGFGNTVASLGTALTEEQVALIARFSKNVAFAFDADTSGQSAASRSIEIAQKLGLNVSVVLIPSGKDPDEAIRTAAEEWKKALENAVPAMEYEFKKAFSQVNSSTLEGKKKVMEQLLPIIQRLPQKTEQEFYLKQLSFDLEVSLKNLMADFQRTNRPIQASRQEAKKETFITHFSRADYLLGLLLRHPLYTGEVADSFKLEYLEEPQKNLYKELFDYYNHADKSSLEGEQALIIIEKIAQGDQHWKAHLQLLELYADEKYASFSEEQLRHEVHNLAEAIRHDYRKRRLQTLRFQLAKRETTSLSESDELIREHQNLLADKF
ncbi:MAG: DNA primase [Candidatus Altimarinota bacterium]